MTPTQSPDTELKQQMKGHPILPESVVIIKGPRLRAYSQEHGDAHEFIQLGSV